MRINCLTFLTKHNNRETYFYQMDVTLKVLCDLNVFLHNTS